MRIGDLVKSVRPNGLFCGSIIYDFAVVVSVQPLVLVSEQGDMMWTKISPKSVVAVGRAFDASLANAAKRYQRELGLIASVLETKKTRVFYCDQSTDEMKAYAGHLDDMDDLMDGLGTYLRQAITDANAQDFEISISFAELTDAEVFALNQG